MSQKQKINPEHYKIIGTNISAADLMRKAKENEHLLYRKSYKRQTKILADPVIEERNTNVLKILIRQDDLEHLISRARRGKGFKPFSYSILETRHEDDPEIQRIFET